MRRRKQIIKFGPVGLRETDEEAHPIHARGRGVIVVGALFAKVLLPRPWFLAGDRLVHCRREVNRGFPLMTCFTQHKHAA